MAVSDAVSDEDALADGDTDGVTVTESERESVADCVGLAVSEG